MDECGPCPFLASYTLAFDVSYTDTTWYGNPKWVPTSQVFLWYIATISSPLHRRNSIRHLVNLDINWPSLSTRTVVMSTWIKRRLFLNAGVSFPGLWLKDCYLSDCYSVDTYRLLSLFRRRWLPKLSADMCYCTTKMKISGYHKMLKYPTTIEGMST